MERELKEEWRDIKNYEGYYQISSLGRVRSLDRVIETKKKTKRTIKGKLLTPQEFQGEKYIRLCKNKWYKTKYIKDLIEINFK